VVKHPAGASSGPLKITAVSISARFAATAVIVAMDHGWFFSNSCEAPEPAKGPTPEKALHLSYIWDE
jgi:hypothetical protein